MHGHQRIRQVLGLIGAVGTAILLSVSGPAGAAHAVAYDFASWVVPDREWYYPGNRLYVTAYAMDHNHTNTPGTLYVVFDPAFKGVVVVNDGGYTCTRSSTPAGQLFPGTWFTCNASAITNHGVRFYAVAPDQTGRYGISTIVTKRGPQGPDADESDNSSGISLLIANP